MRRFLAEYIAVSPGSSVAEAVQLLAGPPLVRMVHTKEGAQVSCAVLSYGSAKDRKKAIKALAEHVGKLVDEEWGHIVLICALTLVDDTTLLRKSLVSELQVGSVRVAVEVEVDVSMCWLHSLAAPSG